MKRLLIGLLLAVATAAPAAVFEAGLVGRGLLAFGQTIDGGSANSVRVGSTHRYRAIVFSYVNGAGTATVAVEMSCNGGTNWLPIAGSSVALTVSNSGFKEIYPACEYRTIVSSCAACNVTTQFFLAAGQP